ncbi:MAG: Rrf2 family transcriptional regulator [Elusimicrobia bacterium]|nr:Rrf2 family transcriptional regulator [Elusimicrobiota bacterium]
MAANSRFAVAVHALSMLAFHKEKRQTSRDIAGSVATNPVVIRRLLAQLARAGIVEASHGAKGGFRLAKPAGRVSLHDIYQAVEEGAFFVQHEKRNEKCPLACRMQKILAGVFTRVESKVLPELKRTTLADIVGEIGLAA